MKMICLSCGTSHAHAQSWCDSVAFLNLHYSLTSYKLQMIHAATAQHNIFCVINGIYVLSFSRLLKFYAFDFELLHMAPYGYTSTQCCNFKWIYVYMQYIGFQTHFHTRRRLSKVKCDWFLH